MDLEVFDELFPVVVDALGEGDVGLDDQYHLAEVDRVLLHILPEHEIPLEELTNLPLDLLELVLGIDYILNIQLPQIYLIIQLLTLLPHSLLNPFQS